MAISSVLGSSALLPAGLGFRNVLINGGMDVWQRGTAVKYNAGQGAYGPDRWCGAHQYQTSRTQRVSVTPTSSELWCPYACRVSNPSSAEVVGGSRMRLEQKVESLNSYPLRGRLVTLSFWIRFSASNFTTTSGSYQDFAYQINAYTSTTDSATNTTAADVGTVGYITAGAFPTTWTKYTINYLLPSTTNNVEVVFGMIGLGVQTSSDVNWYEVTQVQLEANLQPTPFEQRPVRLELSLCKSYFCGNFPLNTAPSNGQSILDSDLPFFHAFATNLLRTSWIRFPVEMRVQPDITFYRTDYTGNNGQWGIYVGSWQPTGAIAATEKSTHGFQADIGYTATAYMSYLGAGYWTASAEL